MPRYQDDPAKQNFDELNHKGFQSKTKNFAKSEKNLPFQKAFSSLC